jgi:nucleolar MIF4G domain-containing protein 1
MIGKKSVRKALRKPLRKISEAASPAFVENLEDEDPDDKEIRRLEKLLKISQKSGKNDKRKVAQKLNKEFGLYEGLGEDFGDFLNDLDDLTDMVQAEHKGKSSKRKHVFAGMVGDDSEVEEHHMPKKAHILDDDMQEQSDVDEDGNDDSDECRNYAEESDMEDGSSDVHEIDVEGDEMASDTNIADDDEDNSDEEAPTLVDIYQPTKGEDIYGRKVLSSENQATTTKYVPPSKRKLMEVDENSDAVRILRRAINGLMNRLSSQTKDSVIRSLKDLYDANSTTIASTVLRDCIVKVCANETQMMATLIPTYAAIIAALHGTVGRDVGAFVIECLVKSLHASIVGARDNAVAQEHSLISSKQAGNYLLLLVYLYNLHVIHHKLIVDFMELIISSFDSCSEVSTSSDRVGAVERNLELILLIVDHCGSQLHSDDRDSLRRMIAIAQNYIKKNESTAGDTTGTVNRIQFMLESIQELGRSKSRRSHIHAANKEAVTALRKWLSGTKVSLLSTKKRASNSSVGAGTGSETCLHVSLNDLLNADTNGRWWRSGHSWAGKEKAPLGGTEGGHVDDRVDDRKISNGSTTANKLSAASTASAEEAMLLKLAEKMRFKTSTRRNIFVVVMSSGDLSEAFERLNRLDLRGKADREIVRVLFECCAQESTYNPFYAELLSLFCQNNRQYKTTCAYALWDFQKVLNEDGIEKRRVVNTARLASHFVCSFDIHLSAVIKRMEVFELSGQDILFLATFFMAYFTDKVDDETFQKSLDRVATTKDFMSVRDGILFFLQV